MKRTWVSATVAALAVLALATPSAVTPSSDAKPTASPKASLDRLREGNERFVTDPAKPLPIDEARRQAQASGQNPFAIVLSCADSRVPPEAIFNVGLGELFVVRTAGEAVDKAVLASAEYAVEHLHVPLLVVMGHESCGAVKAAVETRDGAASMGPNLDYLVKNIKPAFDRLTTPADVERLRDAVLANVEQVVNDLFDRSDVLTKAVQNGHLQMVGAYYELGSGRVRFSAPVTSSPAAAAGTHP